MFIINKLLCFKRSNQQSLPIVKKPEEKTIDSLRYNCLLATIILLLVMLIVSLPGNVKQSDLKPITNRDFNEYIPTTELEYLSRTIQLERSFNSNKKYYDLNTTLMAIDSKHFVIKQEHIGENFQISKDQSKVKFRCDKLFSKEMQDRMYNSSTSQPKWQQVSKKHQDEFTYDNSIKFEDKYEQRKSYNKVSSWSKEKLEHLAKAKNTCGDKNVSQCAVAIDKYSSLIRGKRGIVFSGVRESPWAEASLLALGAEHITTVSHVTITTNNDRLTTLTMKEFLEKHENSFQFYDFAFSFTTLDQEGMGKNIAEEINPFSDLEMIARINCLLKPKSGFLFLGLPVGYESLIWNNHRVYGYRRLSTLLKLNWVAIDLIGNYQNILNGHINAPIDSSNQPIFVLKKREDMSTMNSA